jgi:hypothetical protein
MEIKELNNSLDVFISDILDLIEINDFGKKDLLSKMKRLCQSHKEEIIKLKCK